MSIENRYVLLLDCSEFRGPGTSWTLEPPVKKGWSGTPKNDGFRLTDSTVSYKSQVIP